MDKEKIIYLVTNSEIKINSIVDLNNLKIRITEEFIKDNPDLFEIVIDNKHSLSENVKKQFSDVNLVNTDNYLFMSEEGCGIYKDEEYFVVYTNEYFQKDLKWTIHNSKKTVNGYCPDIKGIKRFKYKCNAETWLYLQISCYTEDGAALFKDSPFITVCTKTGNMHTSKFSKTCNRINAKNQGYLWFSTKETATKYLKYNLLQYYENILLKYKTPLYIALKEKEPKLYWLKVMQLISDTIGNKLNKNNSWTIIHTDDGYKSQKIFTQDSEDIIDPLFSTKDLCDTCIKLLKGKLNIIYGN